MLWYQPTVDVKLQLFGELMAGRTPGGQVQGLGLGILEKCPQCRPWPYIGAG